MNAFMETENVEHTTPTAPERVSLPSESGNPQVVARCPDCKIAVWSNYGGDTDAMRFVKVGTLDDPDSCPPDIQIYTASKQPWIKLSDEIPAVEEYYDRTKYWSKESLDRREKLIAGQKAKKADEQLVEKTENMNL